MRYGSISFTASRQVSARPSVIGSPCPTMPALVCTLRNSQRGLTRVISSLVTFKLSLGEMGASLPTRCWAAASAASKAASPAPAKALAMTDRREVIDMTNYFIQQRGQKQVVGQATSLSLEFLHFHPDLF